MQTAETLNWNVAPADHQLILDIAARAQKKANEHGFKLDKLSLIMDLTALHANGTKLRLADLLNADDANFGHDVFGIRKYIDRQTGQLTDCFVPRFAAR